MAEGGSPASLLIAQRTGSEANTSGTSVTPGTSGEGVARRHDLELAVPLPCNGIAPQQQRVRASLTCPALTH